MGEVLTGKAFQHCCW